MDADKRWICRLLILCVGLNTPPVLRAEQPANATTPSGKVSTEGWLDFADVSGFYQLKYPPHWEVHTTGNAVVFTDPNGPKEGIAFGVMPRAERSSPEEAVAAEFKTSDRPKDLVKAAAHIGDKRAIRVVGSKKGEPDKRLAEFYVQSGPHQYYILCEAPKGRWNDYGRVFNSILTSIKFLK